MLQERIALTACAAVLCLVSACRTAPPKPAAVQPLPPAQQPPRQARLNPAATALVEKARVQAGRGDFVAADATLERAQHIDPRNPLVWVEMGQVRLAQGNPVQAENFGHKALLLASGDPAAQARARRLIADSLKAQGKDPAAADAQHHADALTAH
jgi:Tfp pilus assembly protein PilF